VDAPRLVGNDEARVDDERRRAGERAGRDSPTGLTGGELDCVDGAVARDHIHGAIGDNRRVGKGTIRLEPPPD
jgi:hypothetical protein